MDLPNPSIMYTTSPQGGIEIEGRKTRQGASSMKIGAYTKDWQVYDIISHKIKPEDFPYEVTEYMYKVKLTTFIPFALFYDVKRYDTVGWWLCSYQEILRHLFLGDTFMKSPDWGDRINIIQSIADEIYDYLIGYYDLILKVGDTSDSQWYFYVDEHSGSASPFDDIDYWGGILDSSKQLDVAKAVTMSWEKQFFNSMLQRKKNLNCKIPYLVKASNTYPGFRSRPPKYTIIQQPNDYTRVLLCQKWRDRKVGGIKGLSQSTWRIYKNKSKEQVDKYWTGVLSKISGVKFERLSELKLDGYLKLLDNEYPYLYDMKTAEKQTGLAFAWTGFAADLSDPRFPGELAPEMYSGIGPTGPLNELMVAIHLRSMRESGWDGTKCLVFSDNVAVDVPLPDQIYLEKADEFCGLNVDKQVFGPPSMVTDNPKHRIKFNGKFQRQVQSIQYLMRPLLACIMNGIGGNNVTKRFLQYAKASDLFIEDEGERKDYLMEEVLRKPETHRKIRDEFTEVELFVKKFWFVQDTEAEYISNLRVLDG